MSKPDGNTKQLNRDKPRADRPSKKLEPRSLEENSWSSLPALWRRKTSLIAVFTATAILLHLVLRFGFHTTPGIFQIPLLAALVLGGLPLLTDLFRKLLNREFGSDLLGGISIITSILLGEYLAGSIIVLMLAGGDALESHALRNASSVLTALAKRMPSIAHRKEDSEIVDVALHLIAMGDSLVIYPHEICPADGVVIEGHGMMDESYLTGEPFKITKTTGSNVISGAINGDSALTIRTTQLPADSRYAKIMEVMRESDATTAEVAATGRSTRRRLHSGRPDSGPSGLGDQRRLASLPRGNGHRHSLPFAARNSDRHHRVHFPVCAPGHYRQESCGARASRWMSNRDFRQDRHPHLWRANS